MRGDRIARADGMMTMMIVVDRAPLEAKVKADGSATHAGTPRLLAAGGTSAGRLRVREVGTTMMTIVGGHALAMTKVTADGSAIRVDTLKPRDVDGRIAIGRW